MEKLEYPHRSFVEEGSIVRRIWGSRDMVLLIFAGASAEFALNRAVDWLYFTGRLPADPLGRLFSTVSYARRIIFAGHGEALAAIDQITAIHKGVESARGGRIPDEAYLDVLFMLIDYSIRSFELLERKMTGGEKAAVFEVFYRVGVRMGLKALPENYRIWKVMRLDYLERNLVRSTFSMDLYKRYQSSLGNFRYRLLLMIQAMLVPDKVRRLAALPMIPFCRLVSPLYRLVRFLHIDRLAETMLLPSPYKGRLADLTPSA